MQRDLAGIRHTTVRRAGQSWRWFRAFRRTRPFWGGLWLTLGGYVVLHFANTSLAVALGSGWHSSASFILGGAMIMFGLVVWFAPHYSALVGIVGVLLSLAAFVAANFGGFLLGTMLGILGGSMVWGWGPKKPSRTSLGTDDASNAN